MAETNDKLSLRGAELMAQKLREKKDVKVVFDLITKAGGRKQCEWLDPHCGFFKMDGIDGFLFVNDFDEMELWVENQRVIS